MSKRFVLGVGLAGAISGGLLFACSSSDSHPPVLPGCTMQCGLEHQGFDATTDHSIDAPSAIEASSPDDTGIDSFVPADATAADADDAADVGDAG